jgi:hypothetical protein
MDDQSTSQSNDPEKIREQEYLEFRKGFNTLAEIYVEESDKLHPRRIKEAVRRASLEGMKEFLPGMTRRYPRDIIGYLETGRDPEDDFELGGAL